MRNHIKKPTPYVYVFDTILSVSDQIVVSKDYKLNITNINTAAKTKGSFWLTPSLPVSLDSKSAMNPRMKSFNPPTPNFGREMCELTKASFIFGSLGTSMDGT